jgi:flavin reductase
MSTLEDTFKSAMRRLAATVNVITCESEGSRYGITATAVTSLSADPQSLLVCVNRGSSICPIITERRAFCVNILGAHHVEISRAFGGASPASERFLTGDWTETDDGLPLLLDAQASLICELDNTVSYGTHNVFFGRVRDIKLSGDIRPLIYGDGRYCQVA